MGPNGCAQDEDGGSRAGPRGAPVGYSLGDAAWTAGRGRSLPGSGREELKGGGVGMGSVRRPGQRCWCRAATRRAEGRWISNRRPKFYDIRGYTGWPRFGA